MMYAWFFAIEVELGSETDAREVHQVLVAVDRHLAVVHSDGFHKLVVQSEVEHFSLLRVVADHVRQRLWLQALHHLLFACKFQ